MGMKKILPLIFMLIFASNICIAQDSANTDTGIVPEEDIESYFKQDEPEEILNGFVEYNQEPHEADAIILDSVKTKNINFAQPRKINSESLITNFKKPIFNPIQDQLEPASRFSSPEYDIKPVSTTYGKKLGKFSFGTMYNSSLSSFASANYSTGLFAKYEGKYFALGTGFSKSTNYNYDSYKDKIYFVPELKLTKRLSLLDVMQTDVYQIKKSNELVLRYKPNFKKYADDVEFEVGAGQSFYDESYVNSSVRFSTRFKL